MSTEIGTRGSAIPSPGSTGFARVGVPGVQSSPVYDWKRLFSRCERAGRDNAERQRSKGFEVPSEQLPLTRMPASEAQIVQVEARLGLRLPPSLRSFYLQSNGHGAVGNFIWSVRSVEQIGWLREVDPEVCETLAETDAAIVRCLVVSDEADASWWLLDPGEADGRGEWRAGRWSSWHPGMRWIAPDFFGLFEEEVSTSEQLLAREKFPPPPPGTGRKRNEHSVGDIEGGEVVHGKSFARDGYVYVPAEGFASKVVASAQSTARVGEWVVLNATRRSGPWNPVRPAELPPGEHGVFEPPVYEREVAANLSWSVDPPGMASFDVGDVPGTENGARAIRFGAPGIYKLQGHSLYPLSAISNAITIRVE